MTLRSRLRALVDALPNGAAVTLPVEDLKRWLDAEPPEPAPEPRLEQDPTVQLTWREKLWTVPAETRLGREELLEALGRSRHWLYRHTGPACEDRIPHRKLGGELVFLAGEVRHWIRTHEESEVEGPMTSPRRLEVS